MQAMQAVEEYLKYWGFENHPFLLSPQPSMLYEGGQYFECLQRLRYAVRTQKGGVVIVSEEAGLGKTTIILKLIEEMKAMYGESFKFALIEHPVLTPEQMIAYITAEITGLESYDDKVRNILALKDHLSDLFDKGGKCIIVVDEAHMLKDSPNVLQELRMLINLTYKENYLHTFIMSGQKPLWIMLSQMKEFWQRLPVRYYLLPLSFDETKSLVEYRIKKAGCKRDNIYTREAVKLIHRSSGGCPRTTLALCDLSLLVGYTNFAAKVGEKEVLKAIEILSGKGEALPYIEEVSDKERKPIRIESERKERPEIYRSEKRNFYLSKGFLLVLFFIIGPLFVLTAYLYKIDREFVFEVPALQYVQVPKEVIKEPVQPESVEPKIEKEEKREAKVKVTGANVRVLPNINAQRIAVLMRGERFEILDEQKDEKGQTWFMIELLGDRYGWISEKVVEVK